MGNPKVPITRPYIPDNTLSLVQQPLESGWLTQGPMVKAFQKSVGDLCGARYAQATSNCTTALFVTLAALGVGPGDEVITTPYSFPATANVIVHLGAKPVFVDIDLETFNIDPRKIEAAVSAATVGIMPVHQVGLPADLDLIKEVADRNGLWVMEDAACALGSKYKDRPIGGGSTAACFSFHPRKLITTGEGGMVVSNDRELMDKISSLVSHGATVDEVARHKSAQHINTRYTLFGYNFRMSDIQAAVGLAQMDTLAWQIGQRVELARRYTRKLSPDGRIATPLIPDFATPNYQSYMLRLPGLNGRKRDGLIDFLRAQGVASNPGITGIPFEPAYLDRYGPVVLPNCAEAMETALILPLFPQMTGQEQNLVIDSLFRGLDEAG